jgi:hypothetical protein
MNWFDVDKQGLAKLLERKGKAFVVFEILQNALDTDATYVDIVLETLPNKAQARLTIGDDDPDGFANLADSWTLFAQSVKLGNPEKRGRFNLGEKLVLALCETAIISSTTGTVRFDKDGRHVSREKRPKGSVFDGTLRMTRSEYGEVCKAVRTILVPYDKRVRFNGEELPEHKRIEGFRIKLPTEVGDSESILRRTVRETLVQLHAVEEGEEPHLYEMGIPIVELTGGEPWHVDIHQRVLLNSDRDNVTPAYLRDLRIGMLNAMHPFIKGADQATAAWVRDAMSDPGATKEAVAHVKTERFGEKAVAYDPSDPEGSKIAAHEGYTVIPGGALSKGEWDNLKRDELVLPAGKVTPSKTQKTADTRILDLDEETPGMKKLRLFVKDLAEVLVGGACYAGFIDAPKSSTLAHYHGGVISYNVGRLGQDWFAKGVTVAQLDITLHELGHAMGEADHLSKSYNDALTLLGAKLALYITDHPFFLRERFW